MTRLEDPPPTFFSMRRVIPACTAKEHYISNCADHKGGEGSSLTTPLQIGSNHSLPRQYGQKLQPAPLPTSIPISLKSLLKGQCHGIFGFRFSILNGNNTLYKFTSNYLPAHTVTHRGAKFRLLAYTVLLFGRQHGWKNYKDTNP